MERQLYLGGQVTVQSDGGVAVTWTDYNSATVINATLPSAPYIYTDANVQVIILQNNDGKQHMCSVFYGVLQPPLILAEIREESCNQKRNYACIRRREDGKYIVASFNSFHYVLYIFIFYLNNFLFKYHFQILLTVLKN